MTISTSDWETCLRVLAQAGGDPASVPHIDELERLVAPIYKKARRRRRKRAEADRRAYDRALVEVVLARREGTELEAPVAPACRGRGQPPPGDLLAHARRCYCCQASYREIHPRYHLLCASCAALSERKRDERLELPGRRALVTGGRIRIGHAVALRLLRAGAEVEVTSRYCEQAHDAFVRAPDYADFARRLTVSALDLADLEAVEDFARARARTPLDILVNNAAISVVRPGEEKGRAPQEHDPDPRESNSWTYRLREVDRRELVSALLVNAAAPFLLVAGLRSALLLAPAPRLVINVVGLDGQFGRVKSSAHPHVNMGKAALNMLTRTSAADLAAEGIEMCSVDVGWITHEGGASERTRARAAGFAPPLEADDAAARVCDPIAACLSGISVQGRLFKDFRPGPW